MPHFTLYLGISPNGMKVSCVLELLELDYTLVPINLLKLEHKTPEFTKINPVATVPAFEIQDGDKTQFINESVGAVLYLMSLYDRDHRYLSAKSDLTYYTQLQWLNFECSTLAPAMGACYYFSRILKLEQGAATQLAVVKGHYATLDRQLASSSSGYIVGDSFSVVDVVFYPWTSYVGVLVDFDLSEFTHVKAWLERVKNEPAIQRGMAVVKGEDLPSRVTLRSLK